MAHRGNEAWLTCVTSDDVVISALVLAESLKRSRTTKRLGVITSENVSKEKRMILRKVYDAFFLLEEYFVPNGVITKVQQATIYAFSLRLFDKCIFLSPNSLVLENADKLFEGKQMFKFLKNEKNGSIDLTCFLFSPNLDFCEYLVSNLRKNGKTFSEKYLTTWIEKEHGSKEMGYIPGNSVLRFSLKTGSLSKRRTHAEIIQFVDAQNGVNIAAQISSLKDSDMGLLENLITQEWLEIYKQKMESPLGNLYGRNAKDAYYNEPIAIIGMSCRYPGANNVEEFWNLLFQGEEGIREPPAFRWTKEHSLRVSQQERKTNAGFLSTPVDEFDARFFGVSPKEAVFLDPQARLLHEIIWESLEDSGIDPLSLHGTHTGIFTGSWMNDYKDIVQSSTERDFFRTYMGNSIGAVAARLSFLLGTTGPCVATESGCSSAMVALDLAVKSLRNGESTLALAGGVNLLLHPFTSNIMDYVIAPNGRCKTFDANADGFGRAEGCGVLVLKRLSDALRDRDNIWSMIRGCAVSQEGLSRSLGTPTVHCEALAMRLALEDANVEPHQVTYVETHGTGTAVGDPMEIAAIAKAYHSEERTLPLVIGSVKTNVGHTESCSGITGIMKTILAMQHELIPKHRNLETLNPDIKLDTIPGIIPLEAIPWPKVKYEPRMAGVSSFGITGTDGHVIIQEAPDYELPKFTLGLERPLHIMKISGKTNEALDDILKNYEQFFENKAGDLENFANAAYTANIGRAAFNQRAFLVASNYEGAIKLIQDDQFERSEVPDAAEPGKVCFLFTGHGCQYHGMAKMLYETSPIFRINFDECDRMLREMYDLSISHVLWGSGSSSKEISRTIYSQTSIFCVEYCLLKLWESWGITPDYVLGHSLGEFAAAVAAGIMEFKDALKLVAERSRLIDNLPSGSMLVIKTNYSEVEKYMNIARIELDFAAVNNPEQTVVAGDIDQIQKFLEFLKNNGVKAIILNATHAFHSRHMDPMLEDYRRVGNTITYKTCNAKVKYISGLEGRILDDPSNQINSDYWVRHTREKVSFIDACKALRKESCVNFLEVGPQPVLSSFVMMNNERESLNCLPSLRRGADEWRTILNSLGKLYLLGYKIDWKGFDDSYKRNKVSLPFHPFHRKSFWIESSGASASSIHPLIGYPVANASNLRIFQNDLSVKALPYLKDHCIGERIVYPGACFTEMCLSAGYCVANSLTETWEKPRRAMQIQNLRIDTPLELNEDKNCRVQILVDLPERIDDTSDPQAFRVKVHHQNNSEEGSGKWVLHSSADFVPSPSTKEALKKLRPERIEELIKGADATSTDSFYKRVDETGLKFGQSFKGMTRYWNSRIGNSKVDEVVAEIKVPEDFGKYILHPLVLDAMFQTGILTKYSNKVDAKLKVPVSIQQLTVFPAVETKEILNNEADTQMYIHCWWEDDKVYAFLVTKYYTPIALIEDVELLDTNVRTIESLLEQQRSSIPDKWEEIWKPISGPATGLVELPELEPLLTGEDLQCRLQAISTDRSEDVNVIKKVDRLIYLYALNALYDLGWTPKLDESMIVKDFCNSLGILSSFAQLVHFYFTIFHDEDNIMDYDSLTKHWKVAALPPTPTEVKLEMCKLTALMKTGRTAVVVSIFENISKNLPQILKGDTSALTILFPTEEDKQEYSADRYYQNYPGREEMSLKFVEILTAIARKVKSVDESDKGVYRILEVGAGTGSISEISLKIMRDTWGIKFEYYYTDISLSFFGKAETKLEEYKSNLKFSIFNIEEDPLEQGIPLNYFDLVICTDVIHATKSLQESLIHLRQTLRPQGTLCFTETMLGVRDTTFVFGLLTGYWRMEDLEIRPYHCCVGDETWTKMLHLNGFGSAHVTKAYAGVLGCITSEASPEIKIEDLMSNTVSPTICDQNKKEWLIFSAEDNLTLRKTTCLLASCRNKVTIVYPANEGVIIKPSLSDRNIVAVSICPNSENPSEINNLLESAEYAGIIYGWGMNPLETGQKKLTLPLLYIVQHLLQQKKPSKLYIPTQGVHHISESLVSNPSAATVIGMAKSLKNESSDLSIRCIDLEHGSNVDTQMDQILYELAMTNEFNRVQVAYRDDIRYEPRFTKDSGTASQNDQLRIPQSTDRYHLVLPKSKAINDLEFEAMEQEEVLQDEVEISVKCFALNFRDLFTILKPSAEFEKLHTIGLDFAGIVTKVGSNVLPDKLKVGDRVFGANFKETQLPSHLVLDSNILLKIPENMTYWEASTLPAVFATSLHCLVNVAQMKNGDTVLIHTGSGGVGLAAIQLAKYIGANIITTAGNARKRAYLKSLGIEHVFHSRNTSFADEIMRVTNGKGVDIVLNSITGPGMKEASLSVCAKNARFVEMSKLAIWTEEEVNALRPDVDYSIVDLTVLENDVWRNLLEKMREHLDLGSMKAIPYVKFDALYLKQALQYFQKAKHIGKVVCVMPEVIIENGQYNVKVPLFNGESTYLITGGLGGIGLEVCKFMLERGATDIVLMGRSPPKQEIVEQINQINNKGCNVVVRLGDVGNPDHCKLIIDEISQNGKPLRGIQHTAGVLRDNLFNQQSWESFNATYTAKVNGTWNLHNLTKDMMLEHFVFYSSITALIGTPGQPNHSAANCFEDAFAHYRHSLGLSATTINWGQWAQVGCAKEVNAAGIIPVSVKRMLNGLESALRTQKVQSCFGEFEPATLILLRPSMKSYLDDRLKITVDIQNRKSLLKAEEFWKEIDQAEDKQGKMNVMSGYLKRILRAALRLDADDPIKDDTNMQDFGVDSLMLIELKNSIQSLLGSRLTVTAALLKNCNTVRELSNAIVSKLCSGGNEDENDDEEIPPLSPEEFTELLTEDYIIDDTIRPEVNTKATEPSAMKTIFVTGCTGQLGPYILSELCNSYKSVEKIVCMIRTKEGTRPKDKLITVLKSMNLSQAVDLSKIECVRGDVRKHNFGMEGTKYTELCKSVDGIIHCAVKANHIEPYRKLENDVGSDIRNVNVGGTINVLKFAVTSKLKHVYFPSAFTSIFGGNEEGTLCDDWPKPDEIKIIVDNNIPGYQASKYVCEMLMKEANSRGIPCKVFRFPWITGNSRTGQLNYANNHYILRFLSYLKVKAMPSLVIPAIVLPVDICAKLSLLLFMKDDAPFEIFNIGHPEPQVEQEFIEVAKRQFSVDIELIELEEFVEKLRIDSPLESLKELYTDVERTIRLYNSDSVGAVKGYFNSPETFFKNEKVRKYIPSFGDNIDSSMNIIVKDLKYVKSTGFFKKFNI